jgi:hypothetical protein
MTAIEWEIQTRTADEICAFKKPGAIILSFPDLREYPVFGMLNSIRVLSSWI